MPQPDQDPRTRLLSCAALTADIRAVANTPGREHVDFVYLPATCHVRPEEIVRAVGDVLAARAERVLDLAPSSTPEPEEAARSCSNRLPPEHAQSNVGRALLQSTPVQLRSAA